MSAHQREEAHNGGCTPESVLNYLEIWIRRPNVYVSSIYMAFSRGLGDKKKIHCSIYGGGRGGRMKLTFLRETKRCRVVLAPMLAAFVTLLAASDVTVTPFCKNSLRIQVTPPKDNVRSRHFRSVCRACTLRTSGLYLLSAPAIRESLLDSPPPLLSRAGDACRAGRPPGHA
jgi:hypothetical protein